MKLTYPGLFMLGAVALGSVALMDQPAEHGLVVHEWGTFTSFQGGDGALLSWKPLVTSALPNFVYDWNHAGLGRINYNLVFGKASMSSLQRMETPVVYFYSDKALTADLAVEFPQGLITEWYPQAREIGPSFSPSNNISMTNSIIHWSDIQVLSPDSGASPTLATDTKGTHYFAARETDANLVRLPSLSTTNSQPENEKFLFYRGMGNFPTPLRVTMNSEDAITLANTGRESLAHLFVLDARDKAGGFIYVARLLPGEEKTVRRPAPNQFLAPADLSARLSRKMSDALVKEGLYPREAAAMVNTWKSSWFTEEGTRVLYVLPRAWTDRTLPMTLTPAPRELTRVMVGRAEVLTPGVEHKLVTQLDKARQGDPAAAPEVRQIIKSLGRFAEPAFYRALAKTKTPPDEQTRLARLLSDKSAAGFE